ncbi:hypothetical protein ACTXT7_005085 [Hymenolepis weldensis]
MEMLINFPFQPRPSPHTGQRITLSGAELAKDELIESLLEIPQQSFNDDFFE